MTHVVGRFFLATEREMSVEVDIVVFCLRLPALFNQRVFAKDTSMLCVQVILDMVKVLQDHRKAVSDEERCFVLDANILFVATAKKLVRSSP